MSGAGAVAQDGMITQRCAGTVDAVVARIEALAEARGLTVFARVDHAAGARAAGQSLPPTVLLLLGDAHVGTPLMVMARTAGLDLPLRVLVWEGDEGAAWLTYSDPAWIAARHRIDSDADPTILAMSAFLQRVGDVAAEAAPAEPQAAIAAHDMAVGGLRVQMAATGQRFVVDEPVEAGGTGLGPSPHGLLAAGLAACTTLTLRLYADRKAWPLTHVRVAVEHEKQLDQTLPDLFRRSIHLDGTLDQTQRLRLMEIAEKCPVHLTLLRGSRISTTADEVAAG
jgi:uncharacterized OsmC-like protein/uncharacterized protein (DUF302 family)